MWLNSRTFGANCRSSCSRGFCVSVRLFVRLGMIGGRKDLCPNCSSGGGGRSWEEKEGNGGRGSVKMGSLAVSDQMMDVEIRSGHLDDAGIP